MPHTSTYISAKGQLDKATLRQLLVVYQSQFRSRTAVRRHGLQDIASERIHQTGNNKAEPTVWVPVCVHLHTLLVGQFAERIKHVAGCSKWVWNNVLPSQQQSRSSRRKTMFTLYIFTEIQMSWLYCYTRLKLFRFTTRDKSMTYI